MPPMQGHSKPMAVIGAGSWGTALAIQCARAGHPTRPVGPRCRAAGRDAAARGAIGATCRTPSFRRPSRSRRLSTARCAARATCSIAVPSQRFPRHALESSAALGRDARESLGHQGLRAAHRAAAASGRRRDARRPAAARCCRARPSPREVGAGLPTAMTVASRDAAFRQGTRAAPVAAELSRLYPVRHRGRRGRRRGQERDRHRLRASPTAWASGPTPAWR